LELETSRGNDQCVGISARELAKVYPNGTKALGGVSFDIPVGTIAGYLGPNGAGKTTTIHILSTVQKPTHGEARVCGFDVVRDRGRVRECVGLATQDICLDWLVSVRANVEFFGQMFGKTRREVRLESSRLLAEFELDGKRADSAWSLSGGQKRRLQLVIALMKHPRVLFADEPSLGLDPLAKRVLHNALVGVASSGTTIMYASNDMTDLERLCQSVIFLRRGQRVGAGSTQSFVQQHGGGTSITVECNAPIRQELLADLTEQWGVEVVGKSPLRWIETRDQISYPSIAKWLIEYGVELRDIQVRRPTLEDAFLRLVEETEE